MIKGLRKNNLSR